MKNSIVITVGTFLIILLLSYQPPKTAFSQPVISVTPEITESSSVLPLVDSIRFYKIKLDSMREYAQKSTTFIEVQQHIVEIQTQNLNQNQTLKFY